jgi:hypothetical protein
MPTEIKVTGALDSALRRAFSDAGIRLRPEAQTTAIVERFNALGISCEVQDGVLVLSQDNRQFNTSLACKGFAAKPENADLFVTAQSNPKEWNAQEKSAYISKNGYAAFEQLVTGKQLDASVKVLDANMSRKDYENLTRKERCAFIAEYGYSAVSVIMGRKR